MTDQKTAFVTGGSGFLGRHIIDLLLADGWHVTAMYRDGSDVSHLEGRSIDLAIGDITDVGSIDQAMAPNTNAVFHAAADTSQWSKNNARQDAINIGGTKNMLAVAKAKQVGRFIHTSSISAYGCQDGVITEESPSIAANSPLNYERSKFAAQQLVIEAAANGLDTVLLNPTAITGPADTNNWARSFYIARDGSIPGAPSGATSMCDVRDVARAHLAAFEVGKRGENYLLGGKAVSYKMMLQEIASVAGVEVNLRAVPAIGMTIFGRWNQIVSMFTGKEPDITPEIAYMMNRHMECSGEKARRELNYHDRDWRTSIKDSFDWLVAQGLF
ncbi:MAG: NAD-dependent epimerase/dehydratase family protein [Alphaproteobacteria bacterium]|nr:MAG: NAD-dependent epimerase/dehydratase family protein [Alphaproteobacteria bacterium]